MKDLIEIIASLTFGQWCESIKLVIDLLTGLLKLVNVLIELTKQLKNKKKKATKPHSPTKK